MERDGEKKVHVSRAEKPSGPVVQQESNRTHERHNRAAKITERLEEIKQEEASSQREGCGEPEDAVVKQIVLAPEEEPPPAVSLPVQTAEQVLQSPQRTYRGAVHPAKREGHEDHQSQTGSAQGESGNELHDTGDQLHRGERSHGRRGKNPGKVGK